MSDQNIFPDLAVKVADEQQTDVAVVGGDAASVMIASMLAARGHRVVWYRGQDCNPHASTGVLKTYACEPVALPGFLLTIPHLLSRNAIRGKLQGEMSAAFAGWVLRAIAESRPLVAEAIASDRAQLLALAEPAYRALGQLVNVSFGKTRISTLYPSARAYASGWAVHDVRRRHGVDCQELGFEDIASQFPHLSPAYTHGMSVADVPVIENAEAVLDAAKAILEKDAEIVRHWPQKVRAHGKDAVEIRDVDNCRTFDWVVRGDFGGPADMWPEHLGGSSMSLSYRERHLIRDMQHTDDADYQTNHVLVDGPSDAWLEHSGTNVIAAGAQTLGGNVAEDLKYLVTASFARIWRTLAGKGWHSEGGRITTSGGCLMPDSRPLLGQAAPRFLEAAAFANLGWTLAAVAGFAMIAHVEEDADGQAVFEAFSPQRFL